MLYNIGGAGMSQIVHPFHPLIPPTTGGVFFVDSGNTLANTGNDGDDPLRPMSTIDSAIGKCTANNGDQIIVMPGHVETITAAAGLALDVAGVSLFGMGWGASRPQINFTTATTADMDVDAASVYMQNFLFTGGVDNLAGPIDINAADFALIGCEYRDVTGQTADAVVADANADRLLISNHVHRGAAAAGGQSAIQLVGGDGATIEDFWIDGNFAAACIENVTTACTNLVVAGRTKQCYARTRNAADVIFTAVTTSTGWVGPNIMCRVLEDAANITEAFVGADMNFFNPISIANADGEAGLNTNITASTDAIV